MRLKNILIRTIRCGAKFFSNKLSVLFCFLFLGTLLVSAEGVSLIWDPSPDANVTGYALHYGTVSGNYTNHITVGNQMTATITNLTMGGTYYFIATAFTGSGLESDPSNEISYTVPTAVAPNQPAHLANLRMTSQGTALEWTSLPGRTYRVVYKDNLDAAAWITASPDMLSTGNAKNWTDASTNRQRFYSVVLLP